MTSPKLVAPAGSCDCHMHVYEDRYPLVPQAVFKPPHAPLGDYLAVQKTLGLSRVVLVQPNGYGFDNRCMLEALVCLSENARAIAIVEPDATDAELDRLTRKGVRGIRYHLLPGGMLPLETLETRLLDGGNTWVKLSAPYETSKTGPPHYDDVSTLARALVASAPERCVWASNWPHPGRGVVPDTASLLDLLLEWADDDAIRHRILVDNPARLYGF
jgi:D-galactarolactone isomerase